MQFKRVENACLLEEVCHELLEEGTQPSREKYPRFVSSSRNRILIIELIRRSFKYMGQAWSRSYAIRFSRGAQVMPDYQSSRGDTQDKLK